MTIGGLKYRFRCGGNGKHRPETHQGARISSRAL